VRFSNISVRQLEKYAERIPSMGGTQIGSYIQDAVKNTPSNSAIVEVGTWLGAGTAQICIGLIKAKQRRKIYCYDRFVLTASQKIKAAKYKVDIKGDTLKYVKKTLNVFNMPIVYNKGDYRQIGYKGGKIGLYIDDASKREKSFDYVMKEFFPHFIPGKTIIIMMDYFFFEHREGDEGLKYQYEKMHNDKRFEFIERAGNTVCAIFRYRGSDENNNG